MVKQTENLGVFYVETGGTHQSLEIRETRFIFYSKQFFKVSIFLNKILFLLK